MKDSTTTTAATAATETTDEDVARARFGVDRSPRARATTGDERDARPARGYLRLRRDIFISGGDERA